MQQNAFCYNKTPSKFAVKLIEELYGEKDLSMDFDSATFSEQPLNLLASHPISAEAQRAVTELRPALIRQFSIN